LEISLNQLWYNITIATYLITKATNLSSLTLGTGPLHSGKGYVMDAYKAIADHRTYPINFKEWNLCIPPPLRESNQSMAAQQSMEQLLKVYCESTSPKLHNELDESTVDTIAKATTNGLAFKELELFRSGQLGEPFINNLSSIVSRSELDKITFYPQEDPKRVRILESIQWKHLRSLHIWLNPGTFETRVMRALVGVTKMSEKVELDMFQFWSQTWDAPLTLTEGDLLRTFVASTSIKELLLFVDMTLEQILSLCRSTDVSRLERLQLWTEGFDSVKVDAILGGLQHATSLKKLILHGANITDEQERQMKAKGVFLADDWYRHGR
jgi:hypothetical protein